MTTITVPSMKIVNGVQDFRPVWLEIIFAANKICEGFFGAPTSLGGGVETYPDAVVTHGPKNADGTYVGVMTTITSTTPFGAEILDFACAVVGVPTKGD